MAATMPFAAMVTLTHRLPMLFEALAGSSSWNDPEFLEMTDEKVQAAGMAFAALGGALAASQQAIAGYALAEGSARLALLMTPPRTAGDVNALAQKSLLRLSNLAEALGEIGSRSIATGLRPAHRKVTANARRLAAKAVRR
jgi:hypothetical protein